jgi:hypothetical protein
VSDFNIDQCLSGLPTAEQVKQKIDQIRREAAELRQQASAKMRQVPVLRNLIRAAELNAKATVPAKKRQRRKRETPLAVEKHAMLSAVEEAFSSTEP